MVGVKFIGRQNISELAQLAVQRLPTPEDPGSDPGSNQQLLKGTFL